MNGGDVRVDTSQVSAGIVRLSTNLGQVSKRVGTANASATSARLRDTVPVLTGRLRSTIAVQVRSDGAAVTYGGTLPYANYVARRTGFVDAALAGAPERFERDMRTAAATEVRKL